MADHLIVVCGALLLGIIGFIEAQPCNEAITTNGVAYRGCQQYTRSGLLCQRWDAQFPQSHSYTPANYPRDGLTANYCRNPGSSGSTIWCYTTDPVVQWEYCDPLPGGSAAYRGYQQYTRSGKLCQRWDAQSPNQHTYTPAAYPSSGLNANYCRNPGSSGTTIWCYTASQVGWDYCNPLPVPAIAAPRTMNIVVHMTNRVAAVRWALAQGANAVEMDLQFQGGNPTEFRHGYEQWTDSQLVTTGVGAVLKSESGKITDAATPVVEMLTALGSLEFRSRLAVIYIDGKFNSGMNPALAGANLVRMINQYVFGRGYLGQVILNCVSSYDAYILAAKGVADQSPYKARYFYTYDYYVEDEAWQASQKLQTRNVLYWVGVSFLQGGNYQPTVARAVQAKKYAGVGVWTVDHQPTMDLYVNSGADSILTNNPATALGVATARRIPIAKPGGAYVAR